MTWRPRTFLKRLRRSTGQNHDAAKALPTLQEALTQPGPVPSYPALSYATVRDFCDSADRFGVLASFQNDLKDAQRPWTVKAILSSLKPPASLLEVGSGEPLAASVLASLGYDVSVCDPFDGSGRGPTEFESFRARYPNVHYIRSYFDATIAANFAQKKLDAIFSISVLEHVNTDDALQSLFAAIAEALRPGGFSVHCADVVVEGKTDAWHIKHLKRIISLQTQLASGNAITTGEIPETIHQAVDALVTQARADLETFYLSPQGHNQWRGKTPYAQFPFGKVISVQSVVKRPGSPE